MTCDVRVGRLEGWWEGWRDGGRVGEMVGGLQGPGSCFRRSISQVSVGCSWR